MYCCCITGCSNTSKTQSKFNDLKFYHFPRNSIHMPWLCEKRQKWINAIRKLSKHSNDWVPSKNATICNAHFIGNKKSENPKNPSYVPTIFPQEETNPQKFTKKLPRFQRNQHQTHQTEFVKIENSYQEFIAEGPSEELANQIPGFQCDSIVSVDQKYDPYFFWNSTGVCTAEVQAIMADNDEKKHCVEDCEKKSYSVLLEHNYYKLQDDNSDEDDLSDSELVIGRPGEDYHEHPSFSRQTTVAARAKDTAFKRRTSSYIVPDQRTEPDTFSELQRHDETELPDTGDLDDNEETGVVVRRCGKAEQNPYAGGISDCYDYDHGMILTSLDWQDSSPAQDPVFSWEKRVEEVPTGDDDVVVSLEHKDALPELPAEISLYCEDELNSAKVVSDQVPDYQCNECEEVITGFRYTCVQCADWDLCAACEARSAHDSHYVLRVPGQRPYSETQAVLAAVRQQILSENLFLNPIDDSLKIEIKSESDDTPIDPETGAPPDQDLRDFDPLPVPDPIGEQRPDSQNSFTDSSEESESDDDADGSPSRNETLEDPDESFSQTDHPHVQISSDESDVSCSPPRKRKCETPSTYTVIGQIQPTPCTETQREPVPRYAQLTKVDAHQVPKEILAKSFSVAAENTLHARPVALIEAPAIHHQRANHKAGVRKKPTSILIQEPQENIEVSTESAVHKLRMTVPHTLNRERPRTRASEKLELSSQESLIYTTDYQIEAVVESEPSEILPEDSERLLDNQPEFYLRLPADTNEESLIQALQSQVYVRLQRDS